MNPTAAQILYGEQTQAVWQSPHPKKMQLGVQASGIKSVRAENEEGDSCIDREPQTLAECPPLGLQQELTDAGEGMSPGQGEKHLTDEREQDSVGTQGQEQLLPLPHKLKRKREKPHNSQVIR